MTTTRADGHDLDSLIRASAGDLIVQLQSLGWLREIEGTHTIRDQAVTIAERAMRDLLRAALTEPKS